jgi:3-hydroxypropanoate dehydrogenase
MNPIAPEALAQIFTEARTHNGWLPDPVSADDLKRIWDVAKFPPTSANTMPLRIVFVTSAEAKEKLKPAVSPGNLEKMMTAPVTAIFAQDMAFYEKLPELFPHADAKAWFVGNDALIEATAFRNSSLQAAYVMLAARALGFDIGAMSGFNPKVVDEAFFAGTSWRANFLCNIGHGDVTKIFPRSPRLSFDDACRIE